MTAAAAKYAHEDVGEAERPLRVCAEAGRKCVRNIHQYPILSVEWIALVDSLKQLTRLVQLEGRMPANTKVSEAAGRNTDSEGTLWDQEAHENAIRILVEEAKVNLCLRMMNEFKKWQYDPKVRHDTMSEAIAAYDFNEMQLDQKCRQFEESLGLLLLRAFQHVETLQLMDIPLLIEHCAMVFTACKSMALDSGVNIKMQETTVLHYFASLMKHAEALNNRELLAKSREFALIHLAAEHILAHVHEYPLETTTAVAEGFSALADNEDFRTEWEAFFVSPEGLSDEPAKAKFLTLEDTVVAVVLKENPDRKKDLRPLLDFFNTIKRTLPK